MSREIESFRTRAMIRTLDGDTKWKRDPDTRRPTHELDHAASARNNWIRAQENFEELVNPEEALRSLGRFARGVSTGDWKWAVVNGVVAMGELVAHAFLMPVHATLLVKDLADTAVHGILAGFE